MYGPGSGNAKGEIWTASLHPGFIDTQLNEKNRDNAGWRLGWLHGVLLMLRIIRPREEGCVSSLFVGASDGFTAEMSGGYFDEWARLKEPNVGTKEVGEQVRLEEWTVDMMGKGGWI